MDLVIILSTEFHHCVTAVSRAFGLVKTNPSHTEVNAAGRHRPQFFLMCAKVTIMGKACVSVTCVHLQHK